ncbi:MAG: hypothetical protein PVF15_03315 [Candidatus Bathyarchaeota archaeon]|jgi:hypothetical protein
MKSKMTIGFVLVFLAMLGIGLLAISPVSAVEATARLTPPFYSMEDPAPESFKITLTPPSPYTAYDVDPSTILVEGIVTMLPIPDWPKVTKRSFSFKVDGTALLNWVILPKIWHMAPAPGSKVDVTFTVTGEFYDSTPFYATCEITVMTEHASPPPPPP